MLKRRLMCDDEEAGGILDLLIEILKGYGGDANGDTSDS